MDRLKQDLERHKENPPVVTYDPKHRRISVRYGFNCGFIPGVKIIADRKKWLEWFYNFEQFAFDKIEPYLSRPSKKTRKALQQYVKEDPQGLTAEMLDCVQLALEKNPLYPPAAKSRKSEYDLSWTGRIEITNMAIRLHDYLYSIRKQTEYPAYLKKFLKEYDISKLNNLDLLDIKDVVRRVMSGYYGPDFKERFWQTFVVDGPILIEQVRKLSPNPNPENDDFLKELFEEFI
jgi:hypothetical protein